MRCDWHFLSPTELYAHLAEQHTENAAREQHLKYEGLKVNEAANSLYAYERSTDY